MNLKTFFEKFDPFAGASQTKTTSRESRQRTHRAAGAIV